jgi:hypothetical protein
MLKRPTHRGWEKFPFSGSSVHYGDKDQPIDIPEQGENVDVESVNEC